MAVVVLAEAAYLEASAAALAPVAVALVVAAALDDKALVMRACRRAAALVVETAAALGCMARLVLVHLASALAHSQDTPAVLVAADMAVVVVAPSPPLN